MICFLYFLKHGGYSLICSAPFEFLLYSVKDNMFVFCPSRCDQAVWRRIACQPVYCDILRQLLQNIADV